MRLVVKQSDCPPKEFQFTKGPVYIGRHTHSQIFLPDRAVSRQHAVIFNTQDGKWVVEDLDSVNKTYLNEEQIHKAEIKTGDVLRIVDFTIEVDFEESADVDKVHLEDTLTKTSYNAYNLQDTLTGTADKQKVMIRRLDSENAPDIKLPAKRAKDFIEATEAICEANGPDELLQVLLNITARQFSAYNSWCALRNQPTGPMTSHAGKKRDGQAVQLTEIKLNEKITEAVEKGLFMLFPRVQIKLGEERIRSAMIAPIIGKTGCFGVLYIDNALAQPCYSISDLDYFLLLSVHTAAILENF